MRNYIDPSIEYLRFNGGDGIIPYSDTWYEIWLESRSAILRKSDGSKFDSIEEAMNAESIIVGDELVNTSEYRKRIAGMSLQYMNFPVFIFKIHGSCIFRDLLFNINKLAMWAESNRFLFSILDENAVYDESNYPISSEYKGIPEWEEQFDKYMEAIRKDKVVDHNRIEMPYSISSKFWISINAKTLIDLISFMKRLTPFFYNIYGRKMEEVLMRNIPGVSIPDKPSAAIYQYIIDSWSDEGSHKIDDTYIINSRMGLILYSQFIRQSDTCISGLYNILIHNDPDKFSHKVFKGGTIFKIHYVANKYKVMSTVSTRLCSFAMSSGDDPCSWSYFLNNFLPDDVTNEYLMGILPCKFKYNKLVKCKFHDDIKFRNEGKELSNCPCPLVSLSMKDAEVKRNRDNNKIGDAFYNLTEYLINDGLVYTSFNSKVWTSDLIIKSSIPIDQDSLDSINRNLDYIEKNVSTKFGEYYDTEGILDEKYMKYSVNGDNTCMLKGLAIDCIISILDNNGYDRYLISFGGDIFGRNTRITTNIGDSKFSVSMNGTFSIFTSGNNGKRGNHIVNSTYNGTNTVVVKWDDAPNNTLVDILATKGMTDEVINAEFAYASIKLDDNGNLMNSTYCASPFFNSEQESIRDNMISMINNVFRPDCTESSRRFDEGDNDAVNEVVADNINGIDNSEMLVFPIHTDDLGTLFEVGHAIRLNKCIIKYEEYLDRYVISPFITVNNTVEGDKLLFDCSKKSSVISMGYVAGSVSDDQIYYELKGNPDNIMLSTKFNHIEFNNNIGSYVRVSRDPNARDREI